MTQFKTTEDGKALLWTGDGEYLRIEPWGQGLRVRASMMSPISLDQDWALLPCKGPVNSSIEIFPDEDRATVTVGDIRLIAEGGYEWNGSRGYGVSTCRLRFFNKEGKFLFEEGDDGGSLNLKARDYQSISGGDYRATVTFHAPDDECLYGMGEYQQDRLDLKGCSFELAHRNSQASVPFVVSSAGYGFLWNNPAVGRVSFASNGTRWCAASTRQIDYWVTAGSSPRAVVRRYADVTGHAPVMPEWGLGFWQCKLRYWNQRQVEDVVEGFRRRGIPLDVVVVDFFHWPHMGDYRFEDEFWPDPEGMCERLHAQGVKVMVSVWPQVALSSENYDLMRQNNLLIHAEKGEDIAMMCWEPCTFVDVTNPEARRFVWDLCKRNYADKGVDAFWLDEAEPEYGTYDFDNYRYYAGPNVEVGNIYPLEYNKGFYEGQLEAGREGRIVNLTRCAWAGSQRYGALVWSGDVGSSFQDLKAQITCAIHMGMAGIPWFTTDMGGFHDGDIEDPQFKELFIRWSQFSCFLPVMRNHGNRSLSHPHADDPSLAALDAPHERLLKEEGEFKEVVRAQDGSPRFYSGADNEPWSMGKEVEAILVKYITIRNKMRPYLRELFDQAHKDGDPIVRGLFYEFPQDHRAARLSDEYMFGPDILVAPVVQAGARSREVYLPGGEETIWENLSDGQIYHGGAWQTVEAPLDVIPLFARQGKDQGLRKAIQEASA